jgi:hypothetical protein
MLRTSHPSYTARGWLGPVIVIVLACPEARRRVLAGERWKIGVLESWPRHLPEDRFIQSHCEYFDAFPSTSLRTDRVNFYEAISTGVCDCFVDSQQTDSSQ